MCSCILILLHSKWPKLYGVLAVMSAKVLRVMVICIYVLQGDGSANSIKYKDYIFSVGDFVYVEPR